MKSIISLIVAATLVLFLGTALAGNTNVPAKFKTGLQETNDAWMEADLGLFAEVRRSLRVGIGVQNLLRGLGWQRPDPARVGMGISYLPWSRADENFQLLLSIDKTGHNTPKVNYGMVISPYHRQGNVSRISLRAGVGNFNYQTRNLGENTFLFVRQNRSLKLGAGLSINPIGGMEINLDYCFQYDELFENQHLITTRFRF